MRILWTTCLLLVLAAPAYAAPLAAPVAAPVTITSYAQMTAQLHAEALKSPFIRIASLGKAASGKRNLWLVRLADPATNPAQTTRLVILCRQHGDEPASTEALLRLISNVSSGGDPALRAALAHAALYVVPMVNPDGAEAGTRTNSKNADLNRDWGLFQQPETRAVAGAVKEIQPALIVDAHNWDGDDEYNADCIEIPRKMETKQGQNAHALQQQAIHDLSRSGYAVHPTAWGEDANPNLAHRWFAHQNTPSLLVETHYGSPSNRTDFERREGLYSALVHSLARHCNAPWLRSSHPDAQDAALFPPLSSAAPARPAVALPKHPFRWILALGLYALAVWGMSLWSVQQARRRSSWTPPPPTGRYSYPSKSAKSS